MSKKKTKTNRTTLLLDGDLIAYRIAAALEQATDWGEGLWTLHCNEDDCFAAFTRQILKIQLDTGLYDIVVAISAPTNYRKTVNPEYKANRKKTRRPLCLAPLIDFIKEEYDHVVLDDIEADDVMGILATQDPDKYLIVSDDKDMLTIPDARIWKDGEILHITPEEAYENFICQALKGDPTDGYYGVKGVGKAKYNNQLPSPFNNNKIYEFGTGSASRGGRPWGAYYSGLGPWVGWFDMDDLTDEVTSRLQTAINNMFQ